MNKFLFFSFLLGCSNISASKTVMKMGEVSEQDSYTSSVIEETYNYPYNIIAEVDSFQEKDLEYLVNLDIDSGTKPDTYSNTFPETKEDTAPEINQPLILPYQSDENTLVLLHFDNPNPLQNVGKTNLEVADYGTIQTKSMEGLGEARRFDGVSYLELIGSNNLGLNNQLTIEARIKPLFQESSFSDDFGNIVAGVGGTGVIYIYKGHIAGALGLSDGSYDYVIAEYQLPTEEFTHLRMTYDGENLKLFVNLKPVNELYFPGMIQYVDYENTFIGWSVHNGFIGDIDEVRISDVVRED